MLPKQCLTHRGRNVRVTMPRGLNGPVLVVFGKISRYDLDAPHTAIITLTDGTLLLWDEVAKANGSIEFIDESEIPAVSESFVTEPARGMGDEEFQSTRRPESEFEIRPFSLGAQREIPVRLLGAEDRSAYTMSIDGYPVTGKSVALLFHEVAEGTFRVFNAPADVEKILGPNQTFSIGEIVTMQKRFTREDVAKAFDVPLPPQDEPRANYGESIRGVPMIQFAEAAINRLIERMHYMCVEGELSPNVVDGSRDVQYARGLLGAIAKFAAGESGPFSLEDCYSPRDKMRDPRPLDAFVVNGQTIVVVDRMYLSDRVRFCIIDTSRPAVDGRPYCFDKISTVDADDFAISMSSGRSIEAHTRLPILRWQPVRMAPGCQIDETNGHVSFVGGDDVPAWLTNGAEISCVVQPVLANGDVGPEVEKTLPASDVIARLDRMMSVMAKSLRDGTISTLPM